MKGQLRRRATRGRTAGWPRVLLGAAATLILGSGLVLQADAPQVPSNTWAPTGAMSVPRTGASAVLLSDGRVLVTGGDGPDGPLASAELFDGNGSFSGAASMHLARSRHASVVLLDGRVLVTGGQTTGGAATRAAEIYDPTTGVWTAADNMTTPRAGHTVSLLPQGMVLVAGGESGGQVSSGLELFDPATSSFGSAGSMSTPRKDHAAAVLQDGRVLIVGGSDGQAVLGSTDVFDPATGSASQGPGLTAYRAGASATTLLDGRVLVAGGADGTNDLASAEVYDPAADAFSPSAGVLATPRRGHLAFLLPLNNAVLIVGGTSAGAALSSAELFTPWRDTFATTGSMSAPRARAAGSPLRSDGLLLVAGGSGLSSAERYGFATVKTDKDDYAPGETVVITGNGWQPGETVDLLLHEIPDVHDDRTLHATADAAGSIFNNEFSPEPHDVGVRFYLTASGASSQAQNTFRDAAKVDLEAWKTAGTPAWQSSTLNAGDHSYSEGDSIPFRLALNNVAPGTTWSITIQYDFANGSKHFFDSLSTFNVSEATVTGNACTGRTCTSGPNTFPIPTDGSLPAGAQIPGNFTVFNGTITTAGPTYATATVSGNTVKRLTISGSVAGPTGSGNKDVLILFGGHLARENEWGPGNGASSFSGASAKMYFINYSGGGPDGNLSINPAGIVKKADLAITKTGSPDPVTPGSSLTYTLTVTNNGPNQANTVTMSDPLALVYYVPLDDRLFEWALSREGAHFIERSLPAAELSRLVAAHRAAIEGRAPQDVVRRTAARLHDELVRPLISFFASQRALVFVPDGVLQSVAFASLWDRQTGRYLVEDYVLGVAPSGTVFVGASATAAAAMRGGAPKALIVGNPKLDRRLWAGVSNLPGAEAEAEEIARLYAGSELLTGSGATKSAFLQGIRGSQVVHYAGHAAASADAPSAARLLFAPDPREGGSGALYLHQLEHQGFPHTRVVVLAACRTASGAVSRVEGALSLGRPFLAAGVPDVIASLWDIDDAVSRRFFVSFHHALLAEGDPLLALRKAQIALLRDGDVSLAHPASWAAFICMGGLGPHSLSKGEVS